MTTTTWNTYVIVLETDRLTEDDYRALLRGLAERIAVGVVASMKKDHPLAEKIYALVYGPP